MNYQFSEGVILGFIAMLCSIVSLGPQNLLAIQNASSRQNTVVTWIFLVSSEALLILFAVLLVNVGAKIPTSYTPQFKFAGVIFLAIIGTNMITSSLKTAQVENRYFKSKLFDLVVVTFLNPLTYLDTIGLLYSLSASYRKPAIELGLGAWIAALFWFSILILVSYQLGLMILKSNAWRYMQFCSGTLMLYFSWKLFCLHL